MKVCPRCKINETKDNFTEKARYCKSCIRFFNRRNAEKRGIKEKFIPKVTNTHKQCCMCKDMKPLSNFSYSTRGRKKKAAYCKPCASSYQLKYLSKEERRKKTQKYRDNNREWWRSLHRINQFNRRNKIKVLSDGTVTLEFIKNVLSENICFYCKEDTPPKFRTIEHKQPLNKNGLHSSQNIVMACLSCNCSKGNKTEEEFKIYKNEQNISKDNS